MKIAVFDLDDVIANLREPMAEALNRVSGRKLSWHQWHRWELSLLYDLSHDEMLAALVEHEVLERAKPEPFARETLALFMDHGYTPVVATAREWHPNGSEITQAWLSAHDVPVAHVRLVALDGSKAEEVSPLGAIYWFIDDNSRHVEEAHAHGVPSVAVMDRPWNQETCVGHRVQCLREYQSILKKVEETNGWQRRGLDIP